MLRAKNTVCHDAATAAGAAAAAVAHPVQRYSVVTKHGTATAGLASGPWQALYLPATVCCCLSKFSCSAAPLACVSVPSSPGLYAHLPNTLLHCPWSPCLGWMHWPAGRCLG